MSAPETAPGPVTDWSPALAGAAREGREHRGPVVSAPGMTDATRDDRVTLTCAECGMQRRVPRNWREVLREASPRNWDGTLRCRNGHFPAPVHCFEGMDGEREPARWRGTCACGYKAPWTTDKDVAWQEVANHLMPVIAAALRERE